MLRRTSLVRLFIPAIAALCLAGWSTGALGDGTKKRAIPPVPRDIFSPSNARTEDGKLIPVDQFFSATRCMGCHRDTHAAWSESLHRNAAREPFYRESADILLRTRGIEFTRHCESCHTPIALFSGALAKDQPRQQAPFTPLDHEGVTCTVCHSITSARLNGTGSFTIRRPALLAKEDGTPIFGDFTDEQILADIPAHKRAVMRPLLKQPEFCATCHKVDAPPTLNGYKHIRGFSAYDEWQQSGASHEAVLPYYRTEERVDCRGCHMPKIESLNDRAAKNGVIASHRWLGANTAAPLFYGQTKQVELIKEFLSSKVIAADIFALKREATGETFRELANGSQLTLMPGEELTAEVVVANRKAAHSFAPEVRDLYEIWVAFEATDERGNVLMRSGFIKPDGMLEESAHVYKAILLDEDARPITRHQIWLTNVVGYNNAIPAGRSDIARFRFRLPENLETQSSAPITLRAVVNYRRFVQEYTNYVLKRQNRKLTLPIVQMAESEVKIVPLSPGTSPSRRVVAKQILDREMQARRWNDYGIALLEQAQYGPAADAFRRASALNPADLNPLVSAAVAEMKTERFGLDRNQLSKAAELLDTALKRDPTNPRARYVHALLLRSQGKPSQAVDELAKLALEYPRDREVARQLGQTLYSLGRIAEAKRAFEAIVEVDPTDFGAYQFLSPIYQSEGNDDKATHARNLFLQWRDDPTASSIAVRFFATHPQWTDERVLAHTHDGDSPPRPVLSGMLAAPEK
ncbi:MAG TPA: tetratricopeptide repeat protein [Pyrinomonadaceae bacterium]|nr:tetratricopeptide repeat protein [Pyrinomonadaceae bacterium]